jgi:hypothetical protein
MYTVEFWYYTDLRTRWKGYAFNDVEALVIALRETIKEPAQWCNSAGFQVRITST